MEAIVFLLLLGVLLGVVIAVCAKIFAVHTDPRIEEIEETLPGANCGGCGYAGCADFARALVEGETSPERCPSCPAESLEEIAAILGVEMGERMIRVAVVRCGGGDNAARSPKYNGVGDCGSANLVAGGPKACDHGCLGLGTCARACPFGAIEITADGLAVVHPDLCTGCAKCVSVCPRGLIELVPAAAPIHVFCNSPEKGAVKRTFCNVSCIGCRKCVKTAEEGQMEMNGFLAHVNYENPPAPEVAECCPTGCLHSAVPARDSEPREATAAHA